MKMISKVAYTLDFKLEALRRVRGGEAVRKVAREIGAAEQSVRNGVKAQAAGKLGGALSFQQCSSQATRETTRSSSSPQRAFPFPQYGHL